MNKPNIIPFHYNSKQVRVINRLEGPWWVGSAKLQLVRKVI